MHHWSAMVLILCMALYSDGKINIQEKKRRILEPNAIDALANLKKAREKTGDVGEATEEKKIKKIPVGTVPAGINPSVPQQTNVWDPSPSLENTDDSSGALDDTPNRTTVGVISTGESKAKLDAITSKQLNGQKDAGKSSTATSLPVTKGSCLPCPVNGDFAKASLELFWNNDLRNAHGCACRLLGVKNDDILSRISRAVYVATQKYVQGFAQDVPIVDIKSFQASPAPSLVKHWEILAPFPCGKNTMDGDPVMSTLFKVREFLGDENSKLPHLDIFWSLLKLPSSVIFSSELVDDGNVRWTSTMSSRDDGLIDIKFPYSRLSSFAQATFSSKSLLYQGWLRGVTYVVRPGSHIVSCKGVNALYIRNDNLTRLVTVDQPHAVVKTFEAVAAVDLKTGPVGIIAHVTGTLPAQFSCSVTDILEYTSREDLDNESLNFISDAKTTTSGSFAEAFTRSALSEETTKRSSTKSSNDGKSNPGAKSSLIVLPPQHLSDLLLDYPQAPPAEAIFEVGGSPHFYSGWDTPTSKEKIKRNEGKGLLLSGLFSIPIMNGETRSTIIRFEIDGQQHMLHNFSVRLANGFSSNNTSGDFGNFYSSESKLFSAIQDDTDTILSPKDTSSRARISYSQGGGHTRSGSDEASVELPPGQLLFLPLELFLFNRFASKYGTDGVVSEQEIYLPCMKRDNGKDEKVTGLLKLLMIPQRGRRVTIPLEFPCRRLNESLKFSFFARSGAVTNAVVVAPLISLPGASNNRAKVGPSGLDIPEMESNRHEPVQSGTEIPSIRGKGVAPRASGRRNPNFVVSTDTSANKEELERRKFETLRNADALRYSASAAARKLIEDENTLSRESEGQRSLDASNPLKVKNNDIQHKSKTNIRQEALPADVNVLKSQFYVHTSTTVKGMHRTENVFFQYISDESVAHLMSHADAFSIDYKIFPVLVSFHGINSGPREQVCPVLSYSHLSRANTYICNLLKAELYRTNARDPAGEKDGTAFSVISRLGVDSFWLLAPSVRGPRRGANQWEGCTSNYAEEAVLALFELTNRLKRLPKVHIDSGRIYSGHGIGAHAAVSSALRRPEPVSCIVPLSISFLNIGDNSMHTHESPLFASDFSFFEPSMVSLLSKLYSGRDITRMASNAFNTNVFIRTGSRDAAFAPWTSRRLHRLFHEMFLPKIRKDISAGTNLSSIELFNRAIHDRLRLEIDQNHGDWWNETQTYGDGGMANDAVMRGYYAKCRAESFGTEERAGLFRLDAEEMYPSSDRSSGYPLDELPSHKKSSTEISHGISNTKVSAEVLSPSERHGTLPDQCQNWSMPVTVFNPSNSGSVCGVQVLQQFYSNERSEFHIEIVPDLPRQRLIMRAIKEINLQQKKWFRKNFVEDFDPKEEEMLYFDPMAMQEEDEAGMKREWSEMKRKHSIDRRSDSFPRGVTSDALMSQKNEEDTIVNLKKSIRQKILSHPEMDGLFSLPAPIRHGNLCIIRTHNVRRLKLLSILKTACGGNHSSISSDFGAGNADGKEIYSPTILIVDGHLIKLSSVLGEEASSPIIQEIVPVLELCWSFHRPIELAELNSTVSQCSQAMNPLEEKTGFAAGTLVSILDRAVIVVYATPSHLDLRNTIKDLAVFLANTLALETAHSVKLLSDIDYRDFVNQEGDIMNLKGSENVIFIGGPDTNKVLRDLSEETIPNSRTAIRLPVTFLKQPGGGFAIGPHQFDALDHGVLFTFPMAYSSGTVIMPSSVHSEIAIRGNSIKKIPVIPHLGLCLAANSLSGYLHLSRMLRKSNLVETVGMSSLFQELPDFVVTSAAVWTTGLSTGAPLLGYWDTSWGYDETQSFVSRKYLLYGH